MTVYSHGFIRHTFEQELPSAAQDREAAIEATASRLGVSTEDVKKALAEETEQC